jgi:hypothetical protein
MYARVSLKKLVITSALLCVLMILLFGEFLRPVNAEVGYSVTDTPSSQSLFSQIEPEEALILSNGKCRNKTASGLLGQTFEIGNKILSKEYSKIGCATDAAENGDVSMLVSLLGGEDGPAGLLDGVMALNGELLEQRPASGTTYIEQKVYAIKNFGKVSAQDNPEALYYRGTGFDLLRPIQSIWGFCVNVVYGLLIFLIIGVAFGIMFRSKLGGDAVVTLQNSIPNIALAMILVPLSYAISGLFIDGITLGVNVTHAFFFSSGSPTQEVYTNRNIEFPCNRLGTTYTTADECDRGLHADDIRVSWLFSGTNIGLADELDGDPISGVTAIFFGVNHWVSQTLSTLEGFVGPLANFLIGLLLIFTGLRIFWMLLKKFLIFTIATIFSPFIFATVAIPGNGLSRVIQYCKFMAAASLHYIVAYGMILLSMVLSSAYFQTLIPGFGTSTFLPPLLGLDQLLGGSVASTPVSSNFIGLYLALLSVVVYLLIPGMLKSIDQMLGGELNLKFITDAIQSARDSIGVARAGVNATRRTVGAAVSAPKRAIDASIQANRAFNRARQSVANTFDRLQGLRPGEAGSNLYQEREKLEGDIKAAERRRREALRNGDTMGARRIQTAINQKKRKLTQLGESAGINEGYKEHKGGALKVEVKWAGQGGPVQLASNQLNEIALNPGGVPGLTPPIVLRGGKLAIGGENFELPPNFLEELEAYSVRDRVNELRAGQTDYSNVIPAGGFAQAGPGAPGRNVIPEPNAFNAIFSVPPTSGFRYVFRGDDVSPDGGGKSWEIGFEVHIFDKAAFANAASSIGMVRTNPIIFKINFSGQDVESDPVRIDLTARPT